MSPSTRRAAALAASVLIVSAASLQADGAQVVRPEFLNELRVGGGNQPAGQSSSAAFHGGNIANVDDAPAGTTGAAGTVRLVESSFGTAFATDIPYPDFATDAMLGAQAMLYAPPEWDRAAAESSDVVFRYKVLLYGGGSGGVAPSLDPAQLAGYFNDADRLQFAVAVRRMRDALKYAPYDRTLRNTLLDAYHDLAVAEAQFAKVDRAAIAEYRLGLRTVAPGTFVIDQEIALTASMLARYEHALSRFGELLTDRMGVDVRAYDPAVPAGMPLGAYIFQQEQPSRSQYAAQFYDTDGVLKTVPRYDPDLGQTTSGEGRVLFAGYKDYVSLVGLLREYTMNAAELARLYAMRGRRAPTDDIREAYELIGRVQREAQLQQLLLRGLLPGYQPEPGDASGMSAALSGLGVGLAELDNVRAFLDGNTNLLGFDPNFLVLIKEAPDGTTLRFDSYDALIHWIGAGSAPSAFSPLAFAGQAFLDAQASHGTYKGNADQVWDQLDRISDTYRDRYFELTGWDPGDTSANHILEPAPGSELLNAHQAVEMLNARVAGLAEQARKLEATVGQASELLQLADSKSDRLAGAKQAYFNQTKGTWNELHAWKGAMAYSQSIFDTVSSAAQVDGITTAASVGTPLVAIGIAGAVNTAVQTAGAVRTSMAEQALERAAANYEVQVMQLDIPAEIAQAKIEVEDRLREQIALTLEMQNAVAMQAQEIARRDTLLRELERIKQQAAESDARLADRYYADPIHFLRAQNDMILADQAFRDAQRWVFFTLRALEFKFNMPFAITAILGRDWDHGSVFRVRNHTELSQLVYAMQQFNAINLFNLTTQEEVDRISLRDDVLAPLAGGHQGLWIDVATGQRVPAVELFRRKLQRSLDPDGNLVIPLNSFALKKDTGFFFVGPRYRSDGSVLSAGTYLDKIDWIKINVVGSHAAVKRDANLSYGGTCYIRTRMPPCGDPAEPFSLPGEFRAFPFFYFRTVNSGATWEALTAQSGIVKVAFTQTPGEPEPDLIYPGSNLKNQFLKERSVAATEWVLTLPAGTFDISQIDDIEIWINHRYAIREMPSCN